MRLNYYAGRAAAILGGASAIGLALTPVIANADWQSSAGCVAGAIAVLGIALKFMTGAQLHEERIAEIENPALRGGPVE